MGDVVSSENVRCSTGPSWEDWCIIRENSERFVRTIWKISHSRVIEKIVAVYP